MNFKALYHPGIKKDLKQVSQVEIEKFFEIVNTKLVINPYIGKKLKEKYSGFYRLRLGSYRIIYQADSGEQKITILKFRHRQSVYDPGMF